jgi:hypothetical protein
MTVSPLKLLGNLGSTRAQKNKPHFFAHTKTIAICPLQGGAIDNGIFVCGETIFNQLP